MEGHSPLGCTLGGRVIPYGLLKVLRGVLNMSMNAPLTGYRGCMEAVLRGMLLIHPPSSSILIAPLYKAVPLRDDVPVDPLTTSPH